MRAVLFAALLAACKDEAPPFYCATSGTSGVCARTERDCRLLSADVRLGTCAPQLAALCFTARRIDENTASAELCYPTTDACDRIRNVRLMDRRFAVESECVKR